MAGKVWTAAELMAMTPAEQDAVFEASMVTDLREVPREFLDRVTKRLQARISVDEAPPTS